MATVPFDYTCDRQAGFLMGPNQHKCVGYVTSLGGVGLSGPLAKDLPVQVPYNTGATPTYTGMQSQFGLAQVVGVIEKFSWNGGVGDAIKIDFYASQRNALQIKAMQQSTLASTSVTGLGWWIVDYDQETKMWYEKAYPMSVATVSGTIEGKNNPNLAVNLTPVSETSGSDVMVYKISIAIVPGANLSYSLRFANSPSKPMSKRWGLVVGTLASASY